jgi:acetolactate synthase-1/2/3 large subunit
MIGGDVVVRTLAALGADTVFGIPGQHALGLFDALRRSDLRLIASRHELNASFAADGYARVTGKVAPLVVSTGPGALQTLAGLQEAHDSSAPVLVISSQIPSEGLGGARRGLLHELPDQAAMFGQVCKSVRTVRAPHQLRAALVAAWRDAMSAPAGPSYVEIPQDVLLAPCDEEQLEPITVETVAPQADPALLERVAAMLNDAANPVVIAGGGVRRSGSRQELLRLAETLCAPVLSTIGGKGAFPFEHSLSLRSWIEDAHTTRFCEDADVLLVLGSGLGELSTNYHTMRPSGAVIQVDADERKLGASMPVTAVHADVAELLTALNPLLHNKNRAPDTAGLLAKVEKRLAGQGLDTERTVLNAVRTAVPDRTATFWDMTILGYWAWSAWDPRGGAMETASGAGGLGYALPAAMGAAAAGGVDGSVLAVSGDGGAMYGIAELAALRQHNLGVTWLIVDDGGYGILREYLTDAFGATSATELSRPDFVALATSFGVPAVETTVERLAADVAEALAANEPRVVVLPQSLRMFAPTHLEGSAG